MQPTRNAVPNDDDITALQRGLGRTVSRTRPACPRAWPIHFTGLQRVCGSPAVGHRKLVATVMQAERKLVADAENFIGKSIRIAVVLAAAFRGAGPAVIYPLRSDPLPEMGEQ